MTTGIITVAYGADYDRCAAHAFLYGRQFTDLPIAVITNLKERCKTWDNVSNVQFLYFERDQKVNRRAKLQMDLISPFDKTLYIDADAVIQKPGIEIFADILDKHEMVFNWRITFNPGQPIWNIYARCMKRFGVTKPISIYNGGLIAFRKSPAVRNFFQQWIMMWECFGNGREMPPLNCAIKSTGIDHGKFPLLYFADSARNDQALIQHNYNGDFNQRFGIPAWESFKPFDSNAKDDFRTERNPT